MRNNLDLDRHKVIQLQIRPFKTICQTIVFWKFLSYAYLHVADTTSFPMMNSNQIDIY